MKAALCVFAACAVAVTAPAVATAADLDEGYYGYGGEYRDDARYGSYDDGGEERYTVIIRRAPRRERYPERYHEPVDFDDAYAPRRHHVRAYRQPYLRSFSWYDRPRFDDPYRYRRDEWRASYPGRW
ncbi:MAG: hypothetical protein ACT4OU_13390 [Hyphomicrobium sp.]